MVFNLLLPVFSEVIDSDAIGFGLNDGEKFISKLDELGWVYFALEDGILHTLPVIQTGLGDLSESGSPC